MSGRFVDLAEWLLLVPFGKFRIKFIPAVRTDTVGEFRFGMFLDVFFDLVPYSFIIPDFFAG